MINLESNKKLEELRVLPIRIEKERNELIQRQNELADQLRSHEEKYHQLLLKIADGNNDDPTPLRIKIDMITAQLTELKRIRSSKEAAWIEEEQSLMQEAIKEVGSFINVTCMGEREKIQKRLLAIREELNMCLRDMGTLLAVARIKKDEHNKLVGKQVFSDDPFNGENHLFEPFTYAELQSLQNDKENKKILFEAYNEFRNNLK